MNLSNIGIKELAGLICDTLKKENIDAVLVGGACVSIYSENRYQSYDLDFVSYQELKSIEKALEKLGFTRTGRCFKHKQCPFLIDFVNPPISIGQESIQEFETLKTLFGNIQLLTPTDCVKDRLASFFHWNDAQAFEQAVLVARNNTIDIENLKNWARSENFSKELEVFLKAINPF